MAVEMIGVSVCFGIGVLGGVGLLCVCVLCVIL